MCVSIWPPLTVYISVSPFDSMCINLTSVHLYISVSIWQCVYQTDLSWLCVYINFSIWPQLTVCLHLMVCVSNWPQLNVYTYISVSIWQCVYHSDLSWLCIYIVYQCLHLTVCKAVTREGGALGARAPPHFKLKILKPLSVRRLRPLDPHPGSSMDLKHPPTQWKC